MGVRGEDHVPLLLDLVVAVIVEVLAERVLHDQILDREAVKDVLERGRVGRVGDGCHAFDARSTLPM
ncbi:hypothetical protein GCM10010413_37470 [Promicromonospora sukumoe]